jgi:hypothetical protein
VAIICTASVAIGFVIGFWTRPGAIEPVVFILPATFAISMAARSLWLALAAVFLMSTAIPIGYDTALRMHTEIHDGKWMTHFIPVIAVLLFAINALPACLVSIISCRRRLPPPNHCRECGYDLRGQPSESVKCPECGLMQ